MLGLGPPQKIQLPFKVEQDFYKPARHSDSEGWEVQLFDNDDQVLEEELGVGVSADFFILSVDMVSVVKPKQKRSKGKMCKIKITTDDASMAS